MELTDINKQVINLEFEKNILDYFKFITYNGISKTKSSIILKNSTIPIKHLKQILINKQNLLNKLESINKLNFDLLINECVILLDIIQMDIIESIANYKLNIIKDKELINKKINIFEKYHILIYRRKPDINYFDSL